MTRVTRACRLLLVFLPLASWTRNPQPAAAAEPTQTKPPAAATAADQLQLLPGFQAELVYSVPAEEQGSWVSMTVDPYGRLITSDQYGKLYRVTPPSVGGGPVQVEPVPVDIGGAHGLLHAFGSLYVMVNGGDSGLYRVRDTDGDDQYDQVELLRRIQGGGEHGPHAIVLSPDRRSLYICAGNHTELPPITSSRVPRTWREDLLLPRMWDAGGHATGRMAPGGWICRTDPDGQELELVSIGYRNEYDLAFSPQGELFTFDADMEWDVGTPWYRATRVNHVTSGSEFGWRSGTGKWPDYYPDSLGSVIDIGPGSPTGIVFGTGARFPEKYQRALFISDWSYGLVYAVHLTPQGATYVGQAERFISAAPLPATDLVVNPADGALYMTVGGRKTQSGLYRISYVGDEPTRPALPDSRGHQARHLRHELEALHTPVDGAVDKAWPYLSHADRTIRYAARVAIEHQPVSQWQERALAESDPTARIQAIIALTRGLGREGARVPDPPGQASVTKALTEIDWESLSVAGRIDLCRAMALAMMRVPASDPAASHEPALDYLNAHYPADDFRLNRELSQLLIFLGAPDVVGRTLTLMQEAATQEEQIHYALALRSLPDGWTLDQRRQYFKWFLQAAATRGGHSFAGFLRNIRQEAIDNLSEDERDQLAELLDRQPQPRQVQVVERSQIVQRWTLDELLPRLESLGRRDLQQGRYYFAQAGCYKCHRLAAEGGIVGPDLTGVGRRFSQRDLLESILDPDKEISDQYLQQQFVIDDGRTVIGRVVNLSGDSMSVMTNMLEPGNLTGIRRQEVREIRPASTSMMPSGLLDTFSPEEIADLLAYLRSGGDPDHPAFREDRRAEAEQAAGS
jgi:putative heme-binding domain-containing protein